MKAAILNSGTGSRMGDLSSGRPKCLVEIAPGETILSRQIKQLVRRDVRDLVITTGPFEGMIEHYVRTGFPGVSVDFVRNPEYATTNYIYSMYLAGGLLRDNLLLMHGDIVTAGDLLTALLAGDTPNAALIDSTADLPRDDFKGRITDGLISKIGVDIFGADCVYLAPIYRLSESFMNSWMDEIGVFVDKGMRGVYAEEAFNSKAGTLPLGFIDAMGALCMEIDTPEDLATALEAIRFGEDEPD